MSVKIRHLSGSTLAGLALATLLFVNSAGVQAGHLPTHGGTVHLDSGSFPLGPGATVPIPFSDVLTSPSLWHWELEIVNLNAFGVFFHADFTFPNGGSPIAGSVSLDPGASITFDIHVGDIPETGAWTFTATSALASPVVLGIDTSVTEDAVAGPEEPGDFTFVLSGPGIFDPTNGATQSASFNLTAAAPEPGTLTLLGLGSLGLAGYGWMRRRRRE